MALSRRHFVRVATTAVGAVSALYGCDDSPRADAGPDVDAGPISDGGVTVACASPSGRFFTEEEWKIVEAASERILPGEAGTPGACAAGVVAYIDQLLSAFDDDPPRIFAGGPMSARNPWPDPATGTASTDFPDNTLTSFIPLTRVQEIAWRVRLYGSAAVEGGDFNDAALGPTRGLRDVYREGLARLDALAQNELGRAFVDLSLRDQDEALRRLRPVDADLRRTLVEHTIEGMYAIPEYGGNGALVGWSSVRFDGDSYPLGYAIYDETAGVYRERMDKPTSRTDPGAEAEPFGEDVLAMLDLVILGTGGERFF